MAKKASTTKKKSASAGATVATPDRNFLAEAVNARNGGTIIMATQAEMQHLLSDSRGPLVEMNPNMKDGDKIAFRATELGVTVHNAAQPAATPNGFTTGVVPPTVPAPAASAPAPAVPTSGKFAFASGIPVPPARRGGRGSAVYGFEEMTVGQSFFIQASDENPNPAKRIASTVSSASKRLEPKNFIVRSVVADEVMAKAWNVPVGTKGAGVWRTE